MYFFFWLHFQGITENCIFRNHSSVTTSCLHLGLFITLHSLPRMLPFPAHKRQLKVRSLGFMFIGHNLVEKGHKTLSSLHHPILQTLITFLWSYRLQMESNTLNTYLLTWCLYEIHETCNFIMICLIKNFFFFILAGSVYYQVCFG